MINLSKFQDKRKLEQQINYSREDLKLFKASVYYFYQLRSKNEISDEVLGSLTRRSCAIFLEKQLENTLNNILEENLVRFLESQLPDIKDSFESLYSFEESSKIIKSLKDNTYV